MAIPLRILPIQVSHPGVQCEGQRPVCQCRVRVPLVQGQGDKDAQCQQQLQVQLVKTHGQAPEEEDPRMLLLPRGKRTMQWLTLWRSSMAVTPTQSRRGSPFTLGVQVTPSTWWPAQIAGLPSSHLLSRLWVSSEDLVKV